MSKTIELKVARRVRGFEGRAKAAEENAARLHKTVEELRTDVAKLAAVMSALATKAEQFEVSTQGRMDSLSVDICCLSGRICLLEQAAKPVIEKPELASETVQQFIDGIPANQE